MKKYLSLFLGAIGLITAGVATTGCWLFVVDEPKMPESMLNK